MTVTSLKKSAFLRLCKEDPKVVKLNTMRESGIYSVDTATLIKELESLHSTRSSRTLKARTIMKDRLSTMDMVLENQAYRSRAVQIKITCYKTKTVLDEHLDLISKHLLTKYASQLRNEFTTQKAKNDAVATALADFHKLKNKLVTVMTISDMLVADLDQTHWSTSNLIKLIELGDKIREI